MLITLFFRSWQKHEYKFRKGIQIYKKIYSKFVTELPVREMNDDIVYIIEEEDEQFQE